MGGGRLKKRNKSQAKDALETYFTLITTEPTPTLEMSMVFFLDADLVEMFSAYFITGKILYTTRK